MLLHFLITLGAFLFAWKRHKVSEQVLEISAPIVWALSFVAIWHAVATAIRLIREIKEEQTIAGTERDSVILQGSGKPAKVPVKPAVIPFVRLRIWGTAAVPCSLALLVSCLIWHAVKPAISPVEQMSLTETKGFIQLGDVWFPGKRIAEHVPLQINISMMNKGSMPVDDMFDCFSTTLTGTGPNPDVTDRKVHSDFLRVALTDHGKAIDEGKPGRSLGKGESIWTTLTFKPLSKDETNGLLNGQTRLYIYVWARWRDSPHDLDTCIWLQPPPTPDIGDFKKLIWHACTK